MSYRKAETGSKGSHIQTLLTYRCQACANLTAAARQKSMASVECTISPYSIWKDLSLIELSQHFKSVHSNSCDIPLRLSLVKASLVILN